MTGTMGAGGGGDNEGRLGSRCFSSWGWFKGRATDDGAAGTAVQMHGASSASRTGRASKSKVVARPSSAALPVGRSYRSSSSYAMKPAVVLLWRARLKRHSSLCALAVPNRYEGLGTAIPSVING